MSSAPLQGTGAIMRQTRPLLTVHCAVCDTPAKVRNYSKDPDLIHPVWLCEPCEDGHA